MPAIFECSHITRRYEGKPVIEDISLAVPKSGIVALVGLSGVGKTTLFNVLAGIDAPDEGRVLLDGADITGCSGKVSYMQQKDLLLEYRTVLDNVILPLVIRGQPKKAARVYAASFFERFGLAGFERKYPRQLSGGMRQRAALLRTCVAHNPVILLDEPFSALDALTRLQMREWFMEIAAAMQLSTLLITHDIEEAVTLSDTIYVMTQSPGRITDTIAIAPPRPRPADFAASNECISAKQRALEAIGLF